MNSHPVNIEPVRVSLEDLAGRSIWIESEEDLSTRKSGIPPETFVSSRIPGEFNLWIEDALKDAARPDHGHNGVTNVWFDDVGR